MLSDLASADLVLWLPEDDRRYIAVDHCRPGTGTTVHVDDVIGLAGSPVRFSLLEKAVKTKQPVKPLDIRWAGAYAVEERYFPFVVGGKVIGVVSMERTPTARPSVGLEVHNWFDRVAMQLAEMLTTGEFPYEIAPSAGRPGTPRVSDGVVWLDPEGVVRELSPNATSCFRHLGFSESLKGKLLAQMVTDMVFEQSQVDEALPGVVMGRVPWMTELETGWGSATLRSFPLLKNGKRLGAFILCRDVSEVRQQEKALMSKDAMIREVHHRVKNNLQTVSALLRMQSRRSDSDEVKQALSQAERRIAAVAQAHRLLSHTVDEILNFDEMMSAIIALAASMAETEGQTDISMEGSFGKVDAQTASTLSVVITELVTNAVEHGLRGHGDGGKVVTRVERFPENVDQRKPMARLEIDIIDNGKGMDAGQPHNGLGTHIVKTLVNMELKGSIEWMPGDDGKGTRVHISVRIPDVGE